MIGISNLTQKFNIGKPNEVTALEAVSLDIPAGQFVVVVGSNGSGKSTLLHLVAGNLMPTKGQIELDGANLSRLPDYKRSRWLARVFQNPLDGTAPELSIIENFRLAALRGKTKWLRIGMDGPFTALVRARVAQLGLGLEDKLNQNMGSLSGGQRQALCLLMAVMSDIKVLLLDEPIAALDPKSASVVMDIADRLIREYCLTAIMVTHNLKDALQFGDRILQLQNGKVIRDLSGISKNSMTLVDLYSWFS